MADATASDPRRTPLHAEHVGLGATFTPFGGWEMPLRYGGELAEHRAVREAAGLFDLSHMGELRATGPDAGRFLNTALVGDLAGVGVGRAKYTLLVDDDGGIVDDLIGYRLADDEFLLVPNAGNAAAVAEALRERAGGLDVELADETSTTALIAVQGPAAEGVVAGLAADRAAVEGMRYYRAAPATVAGIDVLLARTGYTGEDGFELYAPAERAVELWRALLAAGEAAGLAPAGLAARDSLRLEAGMPLHGNELGRDVNPYEAGLGGVVALGKPEPFVGRDALERLAEAGPARVLVGLVGAGRRAARAGYAVHAAGADAEAAAIGAVTSGMPSPTLGHPVALAFVAPEHAEPGTAVEVDLRGRREPFEVVDPPFYRRPKRRAD
ncbi:MAG: glycine cleavage system aminomethyltransferase GcvT [Microbacteriaceae bacterium]|nr:glycine cleavage system aminomethyltransferase GcvT [Microbacteriaceae bacterium]